MVPVQFSQLSRKEVESKSDQLNRRSDQRTGRTRRFNYFFPQHQNDIVLMSMKSHFHHSFAPTPLVVALEPPTVASSDLPLVRCCSPGGSYLSKPPLWHSYPSCLQGAVKPPHYRRQRPPTGQMSLPQRRPPLNALYTMLISLLFARYCKVPPLSLATTSYWSDITLLVAVTPPPPFTVCCNAAPHFPQPQIHTNPTDHPPTPASTY